MLSLEHLFVSDIYGCIGRMVTAEIAMLQFDRSHLPIKTALFNVVCFGYSANNNTFKDR